MGMRHLFALGLAAAAAGVGDGIAVLAAAVPVMAQGGGVFFDHLAADAARVLGAAGVQAGGGRLAAFHQHVIVLVCVRCKMGGQHHAAGVGVGGHRELDGRAAVAAAGAGGPARKHKAFVGDRRHRAGRAAFLDKLARRAGQFTAVGGHKLQRHLGAAHGDGVFADQVGRHAVRRGDGPQRLGAAVLGDVGVGAHILEVGRHGVFGKVHPIRERVVGLGPAGRFVAQHLGAVQELVAVFLAHFDQRGIVGVHLGHRQVGVLALAVQRRDGADNDIAVRPGFLNGLQPL